jgi:hypothetical protein
MPIKQLPRFIIYQANMKEFHICLEAKGQFFQWSSNYAPTLDTRFAREVKRIENIPIGKLPKKQVFDEGTYTVTKSDTKESAEQKLIDGIDEKTFALILNGKKLKGRFSFKHVVGGTVLQKYKDQYAVEEDVLSNDLSRTISLMIPDYDPSKVKIPTKDETRVKPPAKEETEVEIPAKNKIKPAQPKPSKPVIEKPTADKNIEDTDYHFEFYSSNKKPDICLVTDESGACMVLIREGKSWVVLESINRTSSKTKEGLIKHSEALYKLRKK